MHPRHKSSMILSTKRHDNRNHPCQYWLPLFQVNALLYPWSIECSLLLFWPEPLFSIFNAKFKANCEVWISLSKCTMLIDLAFDVAEVCRVPGSDDRNILPVGVTIGVFAVPVFKCVPKWGFLRLWGTGVNEELMLSRLTPSRWIWGTRIPGPVYGGGGSFSTSVYAGGLSTNAGP